VKIELSKSITVKTLEFVGEVNFFEESPYIKLLEGLSTQDELEDELERKGLSTSAIKNIIQKLESLGVLEDRDIVNVKDGFPEREYGKYILEMFENDTQLPFKFKNKEIKRKNYSSGNRVDSIRKDEYLIEKIYKKSQNFSDAKTFEVIKLEADNYIEVSRKSTDFKLHFKEDMWGYSIDKKLFSMEMIELDNIFDGNWDNSFNALAMEFDKISQKEEFLISFKMSYSDKIIIDRYGTFEGKFQNIPIIPKIKNDAQEWLLYLLKREIEKKERYISKDELHNLWLNLLDTKPQLDGFDLEFNFETVLHKFGKDSKYYWLLQSGIDLYPFNTGLTAKSRVIIDARENIDLQNDFVSRFNMHNPIEFIIVDRWINRLAHFKALEQVLKGFGNPKIKLVTQKLDKNISDEDKKEIQDIIDTNNITKVEKQKKEIVHARYWIFDNQKYYKTNNSLDVIKVDEQRITIKEQTTFDLYDKKDLETELITMLGEINNG
jgi:hypothetical protein